MSIVINRYIGTLLGIKCQPCVFHGLVFVFVVSIAATYIAERTPLHSFGLSPLVFGLLFGAFISNASYGSLPEKGLEGISFAAKRVLRLAIVLYGFRLSLDEVSALGLDGVAFASSMMVVTLITMIFIGRVIGIERHQATLIASGAAICGASAVLSVETAIKSAPYKATVAIATVVVFGSVFMFLLPFIHANGALGLSDRAFAIMSGSITHEVAQVAVISAGLPNEVAGDAVLAKMVRVLLLPLALIFLSAWEMKSQSRNSKVGVVGALKSTPQYAIYFILAVLVNSSGIVPVNIVKIIVHLDDFLLLLSMTAIGMETTAGKLRKAGFSPFLLGAIGAAQLVMIGWLFARLMLNQ